MHGKRKVAIASSVLAVVVAVFGILVFTVFKPSSKKGGTLELKTDAPPVTYVATTAPASQAEAESASVEPAAAQVEATTQAPAVLSAEDLVIQSFINEANTYEAEENTASSQPPKGFFNVVTSGGTVSDSNSLEGLDGAAKKIGEIILAAGFRYDKNQNIFYSEKQSWQRNFGFTPAYDVGAAVTGMYYDTIRINFNYRGNDWRIQLWKGRYGITTGAEMGVYWKSEDVESDFIYGCVPDEEMVMMSYAVYRGDELYMVRGPERHWWLTGFRLFDMIAPGELTMHASFFFDEQGMADAFEKSVLDLGFVEGINYQRLGLTCTIVWQ